MKLTFPHIVAYITAGLSWLAALNPAIVTAIAGPQAGLLAAPVIALAGAGVVFIHDVSPVKPDSAVKLLLLAPFLALVLGGCASISNFLGSPTGQAVVAASVDVAVATAEQKGVPAAQINRVAKAALAADTGVSGTLAAVSALVDQQIARSGLPPADVAAAQILEVALSAAIQSKLAGNANLAQAQAAIADILNAVIAASGG